MDAWIKFWTALWVGGSRLNRLAIDWFCNANPKPAGPPATVPEKSEETDAQPEASAGEQAKEPKRKAPAKAEGSAALRLSMLVLGLIIAAVLPYTTNITLALIAAWLLTALLLGYVAAHAEEDQEAEEKPDNATKEAQSHPSKTMPLGDVAQLLHTAYTEGSGVHLATLAEHLNHALPSAVWATRDVRDLLARHEVRVRPGVRVPPVGGREGVHRDDFPPLPPPPLNGPVVGVVVPGQSNNNNATTPAYVIADDPDNPARHTVLHSERT